MNLRSRLALAGLSLSLGAAVSAPLPAKPTEASPTPVAESIAKPVAEPATETPSLPDPLAAGWKGSPVCEVLSQDEHLRALRCSFAPGQGHERHFHPRHFGYALSGGRMRILDSRGTREVDLQAGSSFSSPGVEWHEVLNVGTTTVVYLIVEPR
jgi:quercetin dioxygenase-like cupin family protein